MPPIITEKKSAPVKPVVTAAGEAVSGDESGDGLYQGGLELEVASPVDFAQVLKLQALLRKAPYISLVSAGGSATGNTTILVVIDKPLPILSVLREIPLVETVTRKGERICIALRSTEP